MQRAQAVLDTLAAHVEDSGFGARGLHVLVGDDSAKFEWGASVRRQIHSVSKGVSVLAVGIAADDGLIEVDAPVSNYLPEVSYGYGTDQVTLRHLLTMTSGVDMPWSATELSDWPDLAEEFLSRPTRGRVFQYANASTYTAMRVLASQVGDVGSFVARRLFDPIGVRDVSWRRCIAGYVAGGEGIALTTSELALLGRLIRDRGVAQGSRVVGGHWCDAMHTNWVLRPEAGAGYNRYAMAGWGGPAQLWRLHGAYGQMVLFDGDTVVTVTANDHDGADAFAAKVADVLRE